MSELDLTKFSFLVVDDVRLCRMSVTGILRGLGIQSIYQAASGAEAISILEDDSRQVDCAIVDFKMPEMNGVELLKAIRTGVSNARRDLPVAMLTGYGDEGLVGLALALDVNTFLLKPANEETLAQRLMGFLSEDQSDEQWIRPAEAYEAIDINTPVAGLLEEAQAPLREDQGPPVTTSTADTGAVQCKLRDIPADSTLARDLQSVNGRMLYEAGTVLTSRHVTRLNGLKDLGFLEDDAWIASRHVAAASQPPEEVRVEEQSQPSGGARAATGQEIDPLASSSAEGGLQKSSFAQLGKLSFGSSTNCMRCTASFTPAPDVVRLHNRGELTAILCPRCKERDTNLLCGCVSFMVAKGGFPMMAGQLVQAFQESEHSLPKEEDDPFETLRQTYREDPLTDVDIKYWVHANFFAMNPNTKQLECMIDRIMKDPERVRLLGTAGLAARHMASRRALRLKTDK